MPVDSNPTTQSETAPGKGVYRPKIFIVFYSTYLHIYKLALAIKKGVEKEGLCDVTLYQIAETLSLEVQAKIRAPPKPDVPIITPQLLREADGILFGFPTRYGTLPSQLKEFFDACGQLWATGGLPGKFSGAFVSTATQHGGQETSIFTLLTTLAHFGMMFVPLGYVTPLLNEDKVIMGGGPWGASMSAGKDGTRQPSEEELEIACIQGANFSKTVAQFHRNSDSTLTSPKLLVAENEESENKQAREATILLGAVAVVPSIEKAEELPEKKDNGLPLADMNSSEKVRPTEVTSFGDEVPKGSQNENTIEKPSEAIASLSASKALTDFNIEEKDSNVLSEAVPEISSPNPEIPPIDVASELKPKKVASNDKDTESLIEMSVIDNIFNEARNTFPNEMSKTTISNSKDKEINDISETKAVESPSGESKPNVAIVIAGVAAAAGVSALASNHVQNNSINSNSEVLSNGIKPIVQPGINGEEKLNKMKESYFPPQENSLRVDNNASGAPGSDTVKSPDVESRGILASKAFNKDDPTNIVDEVEPVPVVEAENSEQIQESVAAVPRKKSSMIEFPLPVTATEASGYKKKTLKSSTDNVLPPTEGEEITVTTSQEGSQRKASTFARNSATNLRRFFKSLSIRGKPSDMA